MNEWKRQAASLFSIENSLSAMVMGVNVTTIETALGDFRRVISTVRSQQRLSGSSWHNLPKRAQMQLLKHVERVLAFSPAPKLSHLAGLLLALQKFDVKFADMPPLLRSHVSRIIEQPQIVDGYIVTTLLRVFAKMRLRLDTDLTSAAKHRLLLIVGETASELSSSELATCLHGLASMDVSLRSLSDSFQRAIWMAIGTQAEGMDGVSLSTIIWSLSKMGMRWTIVPAQARNGLLDRIAALERSQLSLFSVANILLGLGRMGALWMRLPSRFTQRIQIHFPSASDSPEALSEHTVSSICYSLGLLEAPNRALQLQARQGLLHAVEAALPFFSSQGYSNSLHGLAKMGVQCSELSAELVQAMYLAGVQGQHGACLRELNTQALANVLWAMGTMGFSLHKDQQGFATMAVEALCKQLPLMTDQGVSNSLIGFIKMGAEEQDMLAVIECAGLNNLTALAAMSQQSLANIYWTLSQLPASLMAATSVLRTVEMTFARLPEPLDPTCLATLLNSLAKRGASYDSLDEPLRIAVERSLADSVATHAASREAATIVSSLAKLGCDLQRLPRRSQLALLDAVGRRCLAMSEQELGNTIWGLGGMRMNVPHFQTVFLQLCNAVTSQRGLLKYQAVMGILQGFGRMEGIAWLDLPPSTQEVIVEALGTALVQAPGNAGPRLAANCLLSLGKLRISAESAETEQEAIAKRALLDALVKEASSDVWISNRITIESRDDSTITSMVVYAKTVVSALNGIARLARSHKDFPDSTSMQAFMTTQLSSALVYMDADDVATVWWSLARLSTAHAHFAHADSPDTPSYAVEGSVHRALCKRSAEVMQGMSSYAFSWSLWAIATTRHRFEELPSPMQKTMLHQLDHLLSAGLSSSELGLVLWALTSMAIDFNALLTPEARATVIAGLEASAQNGRRSCAEEETTSVDENVDNGDVGSL